jgi:phosphomannomutase/phosphoglucomutase
MLNTDIFREYDIRGIADEELLDPGIIELGRAVGSYLQRKNGKNITLGRDCRLSSERLRNALIQGLMMSGCQVTDVGVVPTPLLYYSVFHLKAHGAVMITGSHNPAEYNGFKIVSGTATIHGDEIQELRRMIERRDFTEGQGSEKSADAVTPYVNEISAPFQFKRRVKVVADGGNGTAGPVMRRIFQKLNCDATELFFEMDGRFPNHHPDPTVPKNLARLVETVTA